MSLNHRMTRRDFLRFTAVMAAGSALAACAPAAPAAPAAGAPAAEEAAAQPASSGPKQFRISAWADVQDAVVYDNMVKAWHATQGEYQASVEQYPGGYYEKIQANFAAGDSADVLYFQGWIWQAYAESKVLVPLDSYIERDGLQDKFPQVENYLNNTQWEGSYYMTPTDVGALVIYYNKDLFDKQGIPHPQKGGSGRSSRRSLRNCRIRTATPNTTAGRRPAAGTAPTRASSTSCGATATWSGTGSCSPRRRCGTMRT